MFTNSIGRALGNHQAEEILRNDAATDADADSLAFSDYFAIISRELFQPHGEDDPPQPVLVPSVLAEIDKLCWMLCEAFYLKGDKLNQSNGSSLRSDDLFKLWKVFNFLVKVVDPDAGGSEDSQSAAALPLRVDVEEAHRVGSLVQQAVGCSPADVPVVDPREEDGDGEGEGGEGFAVDFVQFMVMVCAEGQGLGEDTLRQGVSSVNEEILNDIIKKVNVS